MTEYTEYYERKTVERFLEGVCEALCDNVEDDLNYALYRMDEMQPADVKPVVRSKWRLNKDGRECVEVYGNPCCIDEESECGNLDSVRAGFADLWDSTVQKKDLDRCGWAANPWVWVIQFEHREKPEDE